jgi:hypothetical protein
VVVELPSPWLDEDGVSDDDEEQDEEHVDVSIFKVLFV